MKRSVVIVFCVLTFALSAQTKKIAHQSHSGKDNTFALNNSNDNFGYFPEHACRKFKMSPDTIVKLSDTSVVEYWKNGDHVIIMHPPYLNNPNAPIDSVIKYSPETIYIGFEKKKENKIYIGTVGDSNKPNNTFILVAALSLLFLLMSFFMWKKNTQKFNPA